MVIIFDLDGTLINTIDDLGQACNHALKACGFPTHAIEDYPRLVGNGINRLIERALPLEHQNEETILQLRQYFVPFYDAHNCDLTRPYEGIPALLQSLKHAGHTLAVASNKYQAATKKIVEHLFPKTFDVVLGERENVARKPDPQIVWDIVSHIPSELDKSDILYIGDSLVDAATAKAAGVKLVLCTWGFCTKQELLTATPDYMIEKPNELITIIDTIQKFD